MRAVIQRVTRASVSIEGETVGSIGRGYLVLLGVETGDTEGDMRYIADKTAALRIFEDENGKMNLSLSQVEGEILAISQFTLLGDARSQRRPGFTAAARPDTAIPLYEGAIASWREKGFHVETGRFGADMQVELVNDGPVTILLDSHKLF